MKLSAKKKSEIYGLVHEFIVNVRVDLRFNLLKYEDNTLKNEIDYRIAQMEIPLAQKLVALLDSSCKKE